MKYSIITPTFNSASTLGETIKTVYMQDVGLCNVEYIICDGGNDEETPRMIKRYPSIRYIRKRDLGLYDAMNKGVLESKGDVIGFLNSDDYYYDEKVLSRVDEAMRMGDVGVVVAGVQYVERYDSKKVKRKWVIKEKGSMLDGWTPPHPGVFIKRDIFMKCGMFDLRYKIAADYDSLFRIFQAIGERYGVVGEIAVVMRLGGVSNATLHNRLCGGLEIYKSLLRNGAKKPFAVLLRRYWYLANLG